MASASSSSSLTTEEKMIKLVSSDGMEFEVKESVAIQSQIIRYMIEDECVDIPVPNVNGNVLSKILEFCKKHVECSSDEDLKTWEAEFMKVDQAMLYDLLVASNFLSINKLLDLACQTVADMIRGKSPEEIRNTFNIKNDFTPEEEEAIRKEHAWAFD